MIDRKYCMSSFLMFRTIADKNMSFGNAAPRLWNEDKDRVPVYNSDELQKYLRMSVERACSERKMGIALSGGIDSAILAKFMPPGSVAYTFKCVVPGVEVTDETAVAAEYARECGLEHRVVEIFWEDMEYYAPILMRRKNMPVHSIEVQIYKAALQAKQDGLEGVVFGESADVIYGGMSGLLSKDWLLGEFVDRYSYVLPYKVLREPMLVLEPYYRYVKDGYIDPHEFVSDFFRIEGMGSYVNAMETAKMILVCPFAETRLAAPIDYQRIRRGENKYLVREVFRSLYPDFVIPPKLPMPRPTNEWLKEWEGPKRSEFWPHCTEGMTGDQKWLVWVLEKFLNQLDEENI